MSTDRLTTYSADEQDLSFAGQPIESGFADGEFVSIEMVSDAFTSKAGADGEVARSKTNDRRATMKVKLLQGSRGNTILQQIHALDLAGTNGAGVGVFELRDRSSGLVVAHASKAWIKKQPTVSRGREVVEYEWTFECALMELNAGGSELEVVSA